LEVQLYHPHPNQKKIHDSIIQDPYKYYVLNIGRQFGKSMLAQNQVCYWALNIKNAEIAWVSPIYKQAKKVYLEIENAFAESNLLYTNKADLMMKAVNTNTKIQFFSAETYNNMRGFTFDYLVVDEFAFISEEAWTEVLRATVLVRGKKVLLISTPKGKNHFHKVYNLGLGNNQNYKSFHMTSYDNPLISPSEIDEARKTLPAHVFKQEYLAEFLDDGSMVFPKPIINDKAQPTERNYAGVDVGRADDYTVVTIQNHTGKVIEVQRWKQMAWEKIVANVVKVINKYNAITSVEVNGVGDPIFELIKKQVRRCEAFVTTSKSKNDAIEQLIIDMQNENVTLPNEKWLLQEIDLFTFRYNPKTKNVQYSAPDGFHDDGVMSLAICNKTRKDMFNSGKYAIGFA